MTSLWPKLVVKRFIHFGETVRRRRDSLFKDYERAGGKYSTLEEPDEDEGDEDEAVEEDDEESESEDGCDNVF